MQGADAIPLGCVGGEIGLRLLVALPAHLLELLEVPTQDCITARKNFAQLLREFPPRPTLCEAIEDPSPLLRALDQAGVAKQLEVAADPRLALPHDLRDFGNRKFGFGKKRQQPQPGNLGSSLQSIKKRFEVGHGGSRNI